MPTIERSNPGPPKQTCTFNTEDGYLVVTVEDPLTGKHAAACAISLSPGDARGLATALGAFCGGQRVPEPYAIVRPAPDPFLRVCMFHAPSGELAVSLAYKGAFKLAADATIVLRAGGGGDDDATVLHDALSLRAAG